MSSFLIFSDTELILGVSDLKFATPIVGSVFLLFSFLDLSSSGSRETTLSTESLIGSSSVLADGRVTFPSYCGMFPFTFTTDSCWTSDSDNSWPKDFDESSLITIFALGSVWWSYLTCSLSFTVGFFGEEQEVIDSLFPLLVGLTLA